MNMDNLKKTFSRYKITDASDRTNDEIVKISSICCLKKNLLVVIERNAKNDDYFVFVEMIEGISTGKIKCIFLNEDNYYYHTSLSTPFVLHLKRILDGENECPICLERISDKYFICNQCAHICCVPCFAKCESSLCSVCRCDSFSSFNFACR